MEVVDNKYYKILLRVIFVLSAPGIVVLDLYGAIFLYAAFVELEFVSLILGVSSVLGTAGFFSAWYRVNKKRISMTSGQVKYVRLGLFLGVISGLMLLGLAMYSNTLLFIMPLVIIIIGGLVIVYETPKYI